MVNVLKDLPVNRDGSIALDDWSERLCVDRPYLDETAILAAARFVGERWAESILLSGVELAELVASLHMDTTSVVAALFYRPLRHDHLDESDIVPVIGDEAVALVSSVVHMADTSLLDLSSSRMLASEAKDQTANIRRMLVALIDDGRVAVLKLAERVVALRRAKASSEERKARIAIEAMTVFVPLAGRLGIWRLKWELEDLSLRYLETDAYVRIARQLDGKRNEREQRVSDIVDDLHETFKTQGIEATVTGRAKHIHGIWRKMRTKNIPFDEVYDVRAVRVIVADVAQCYAALGTIHMRWRHIPSEFDDYIAVPKQNGYRSIHTAVIGPDHKIFEVQIRTQEMHEESELGVCAHWSYKDAEPEDGFYAAKMALLRQVLDWQEEMGGPRTLSIELREKIREERIFVYTPQGHVVDLTTGATPLDFAYRVHTEVGSRAVGARVDGVDVPLNATLRTGQRVEITTAEDAVPLRAWLDPSLGYIGTARAKNKIQSWFRSLPLRVSIADGREQLSTMMDRLGVAALNDEELDALSAAFGLTTQDDLFRAVAVADIQVLDVVLQQFANGEDSSGQLSLLPELSIAQSRQSHTLEIRARNRDGLLRDVTQLLSDDKHSLISTTGRVDTTTDTALLVIELQLANLFEVAKVINRLQHIEHVIEVRRLTRAGVGDR
jgi:GTP pyrophosphokinase